MTRPKAVTIVTLVALVFAGLASWGVYSYLQDEAKKSKATAGANILVAAVDIPIGTKLNATHLKQMSWPKGTEPQGSFVDPKLLDGRIVIRQLSIGDAITEAKLMPKEGTAAAGVMTYIIPQGHRAVTVAVNEVAGVAGFIAPHNRVDVVVTTAHPNVPNQNISKIILQNVTVLATGQITEQKDGKPVVVPTVTLDLVPEDAEKLVLAASKGSLQLLLRNIIDTASVDAQGAMITKVLAGTGVQSGGQIQVLQPAPVKPKAVRVATRKSAPRAPSTTVQTEVVTPPRSRHTVTVIDGGVRTTKEFLLQ